MLKPDTRQKSMILRIGGLLLLLACLAAILLSGLSRLTQDYVEQAIRNFNDQLAQDKAKTGREAKLSYGSVRMEGWGYSKQAVIENVILDVSEQSRILGERRWSVSTARLVVMPDPANHDRLVLVLGEPLKFVEEGRQPVFLSYPQPLRVVYFEGKQDGRQLISGQVVFPPELVIEEKSATPGQPDSRSIITYERPSLQAQAWPEIGEYELIYSFTNLKLSSERGADPVYITAAALSGQHHGRRISAQAAEDAFTFNLSDMVMHDDETMQSLPYSLAADIGYKDVPAQASGRTGNDRQLTINKLALLSDVFKIRAGGEALIAEDDPIPSGRVDVNIENADRMLAPGFMPESLRPGLAGILKEITGEPVEGKPSLSIALKREKNGVFYVGNMTFEELAAATFVYAMQGIGDVQKAVDAEHSRLQADDEKNRAAPLTTQLPSVAPVPQEPAPPVKE